MKPLTNIKSLCCLGVPACSVSKAIAQSDGDSPRFARPAALRGFVIVDGRGRLLARSAGTDDLLLVCARIGGEPASAGLSKEARMPRVVMDVVHQLQLHEASAASANPHGGRQSGRSDRRRKSPAGSGHGQPADPAGSVVTSPPRRALTTAWGLLCIEAASLAGSDDPVIGVHLELHEPAAAYAARMLREQGVSPVQMQVGVMLAIGWTKPQIARVLGVKPSSVIDAARKLYDRIGVRSAPELAALLWTQCVS